MVFHLCQSHLTEEKGGRCREETFAEYLLLCQMLCWHDTLQVVFSPFSQWSCERGTDSFFLSFITHYSGSPPMRIREVTFS